MKKILILFIVCLIVKCIDQNTKNTKEVEEKKEKPNQVVEPDRFIDEMFENPFNSHMNDDEDEEEEEKPKKMKRRKHKRRNLLDFDDDFFGGGLFGMPHFPSFGNMQKSFDRMRDGMQKMHNNKDNNTHSYSHSEQYFETIDNNNGDAKRVEVGEVMNQNDNDKPDVKVINKADNMQGKKLTPEEEKEQIQKHKKFYSHFKPFTSRTQQKDEKKK